MMKTTALFALLLAVIQSACEASSCTNQVQVGCMVARSCTPQRLQIEQAMVKKARAIADELDITTDFDAVGGFSWPHRDCVEGLVNELVQSVYENKGVVSDHFPTCASNGGNYICPTASRSCPDPSRVQAISNDCIHQGYLEDLFTSQMDDELIPYIVEEVADLTPACKTELVQYAVCAFDAAFYIA